MQSLDLALVNTGLKEIADVATRNRGVPKREIDPKTGLILNGKDAVSFNAKLTLPAGINPANLFIAVDGQILLDTGAGFDPTQGGHVGANGQKEVLLTGDTADKVRAAAQAAVPGGTIQRVETDAEGSPYEAHMTKSDGTPVTVKVDSNYKVTSIDNGPGGRGGPGQQQV